MPAYDNMAVAAKLDLMAALLELSGADKFRFLSYRKAGSAIRAWPEQVATLARDGRLTEIPGVGAKMAANVEQIVERGSFDQLDQIAQTVPPTLAEVMEIPGVGPKRAALLHEWLGVSTTDDLARALADDAVAPLRGFGAKTAENIARGLEARQRHGERTPLAVALPVAEQLALEVAALPGVDRVEPAGSIRRREETIGDVDLLAASERAEEVTAAFAALPAVERVLAVGGTKASVELHDGLQVDLRVVEPDQFGAALQYFTGNKEHNVRLRERAKARGLKVNEYGVFRVVDDGEGERVAGATEAEVYDALGMSVPAPEIRWGLEEIELAAAHSLPRLVTLDDVRGDLQCHSTFTDGKSTMAANRAVAAELGYEYLATTDHAYDLRMVGGLDVAEIERQFDEIDELNSQDDATVRILKGIELNISDDGGVDYPDEVLARFDIALASLHSGWDQDEATVTKRLVRAIEHPLVDVIAHPTGRILGRRDPMALDMEQVLAAAGETGTIMEINSYPDRLDLSAEHIRLGRRFGVRFSLGTDAHAAEQLRYMRYGVAQARRGLVTPDELLNAQTWSVARTWLKRAKVLGWE